MRGLVLPAGLAVPGAGEADLLIRGGDVAVRAPVEEAAVVEREVEAVRRGAGCALRRGRPEAGQAVRVAGDAEPVRGGGYRPRVAGRDAEAAIGGGGGRLEVAPGDAGQTGRGARAGPAELWAGRAGRSVTEEPLRAARAAGAHPEEGRGVAGQALRDAAAEAGRAGVRAGLAAPRPRRGEGRRVERGAVQDALPLGGVVEVPRGAGAAVRAVRVAAPARELAGLAEARGALEVGFRALRLAGEVVEKEPGGAAEADVARLALLAGGDARHAFIQLLVRVREIVAPRGALPVQQVGPLRALCAGKPVRDAFGENF